MDGCAAGCLIALVAAPVIIIAALMGQGATVRKARAMLDGRQPARLQDIESCLRQLGPQHDAEAIDLVRRLEGLREKMIRGEE